MSAPFEWPGMTLFQRIKLMFSAGEQGVWYDPSDFSTLFQDSAGTTPVTAVEQPVGKILDKSGRGNHATQATSASRPVLKQDTNGKYYLFFDGVDDSLSTGSIDFTSTDKMTVFAGVRKLSDANQAIVVELSAALALNNGSFSMQAPSATPATNLFYFGSKGTAIGAVNATSAAFAAPKSAVMTGIASISTDQATLRINGAEAVTSAVDQGTGNYGNYPLFIGRRGGTSLPFNGHLYSLIVRGAQSSYSQIASAESYVNSKTGAY
jgi:hypothetical protein